MWPITSEHTVMYATSPYFRINTTCTIANTLQHKIPRYNNP